MHISRFCIKDKNAIKKKYNDLDQFLPNVFYISSLCPYLILRR